MTSHKKRARDLHAPQDEQCINTATVQHLMSSSQSSLLAPLKVRSRDIYCTMLHNTWKQGLSPGQNLEVRIWHTLYLTASTSTKPEVQWMSARG